MGPLLSLAWAPGGRGSYECITALRGRAGFCIWCSEDPPPRAGPFLSVSNLCASGFSASSRRQAHGLRQHAAAVRDDVRPTWQGPCSPSDPRPGPGQRWTPLLLCKVCIYSPLGLQRGWGAGQMVCSLDKEEGGGEAEGGAPSGHSGGRPALLGGGAGPRGFPAPLLTWPLPC